jgi:transketolase
MTWLRQRGDAEVTIFASGSEVEIALKPRKTA